MLSFPLDEVEIQLLRTVLLDNDKIALGLSRDQLLLDKSGQLVLLLHLVQRYKHRLQPQRRAVVLTIQGLQVLWQAPQFLAQFKEMSEQEPFGWRLVTLINSHSETLPSCKIRKLRWLGRF